MDLTLVNLDLSQGKHTLNNSPGADPRQFRSWDLVNEKSNQLSVNQSISIENDLGRISIREKEMDQRKLYIFFWFLVLIQGILKKNF